VPVSVRARDLTHLYPKTERPVLDAVDLDVTAGGYLALTGPSGAGKTTLLAILGGLERPSAGSVEVDGRDITRMSGRTLARYRREVVGFVFQDFGLIDVLSALGNVEVALALGRIPPRRRRREATSLLAEVGLEDRAYHRPAELSGGERQRVGIARALAHDPSLILADEPTGNLDPATGGRVLDLLEEARQRRGATLVVVTHDPLVAARAEHRLHLEAGRWVA
jgi:putative ABC transport system ATP-binding protein